MILHPNPYREWPSGDLSGGHKEIAEKINRSTHVRHYRSSYEQGATDWFALHDAVIATVSYVDAARLDESVEASWLPIAIMIEF